MKGSVAASLSLFVTAASAGKRGLAWPYCTLSSYRCCHTNPTIMSLHRQQAFVRMNGLLNYMMDTELATSQGSLNLRWWGRFRHLRLGDICAIIVSPRVINLQAVS